MQVAFYLARKITQVLDAIPWVRCASGNVFFTFCVVTYRHCRSVPLKLWYFKQEDVKPPKLHIISKSNLVDSQRCLCFLVILLWQSQSILDTKGIHWNCYFPGWTTSVGFKGVSHQVFLFFSLPPCLFVDDLCKLQWMEDENPNDDKSHFDQDLPPGPPVPPQHKLAPSLTLLRSISPILWWCPQWHQWWQPWS